MNDEEKRTDSKEKFNEEQFMSALFETYRHQYGDCTITEIAEEKPA